MTFNSKTGVVALIGLLMLGIVSFLGFYDFSARFDEKDIQIAEKAHTKLSEKKDEFILLEKNLNKDWVSLEKSFKTRDYRKARLLINNFLYLRDNYNLPERYKKIDVINARLKKIEKVQKGTRERLPAYEKLTFLAGTVYRKEGPLDFKKRKEVWIAVKDEIPHSMVDKLGSKVLLKEQEDFAWTTLYVQKASDKRGMSFAIFDIKEGIYSSFIAPEVPKK